MAITTLSMVLTVFILNLHHISDRPVPTWIKKLVLIYFAKLVGMCEPGAGQKQSRSDSYHTEHVHLLPSQRALFDKTNMTHNARAVIGKENGDAILEIHRNQDIESQESSYFKNGLDIETDSIKDGSVLKPKPKEDANDPRIKKDKTELYAKEWRRVAEVFDRLFFWLFLLAILISTLVLFHPLTDAYIRDNQLSGR